MRVYIWLALALGAGLSAQDAPSDRLPAATGPVKTDERIAIYEKLARSKPDDFHYQNLLAGAYIQKMRETTDFGYIDRAEKVVNSVMAAEKANYEALRLRSEIGL